jgi:hypothetical protein
MNKIGVFDAEPDLTGARPALAGGTRAGFHPQLSLKLTRNSIVVFALYVTNKGGRLLAHGRASSSS